MLLVQISDIHCGSGHFNQDAFDKAVHEINDLKPEVMVITGDLTNNGLLSEYRQAKEQLARFKCESKVFCSGNHDYKSTGYLHFKRFFTPKQLTEIKDTVIATLGTARPDRDEGEVGHRQLVWLERAMAKYRDRRKIVAMHHHVISVPDTGTDRTTVVDAGDALRTLLQSGVDLTLCGHRHRPWMWRLGRMVMVHAGTLSSERMRGFFANSYNIIELDEESIRVTLKVVGGKAVDLGELTKKRPA